MQTFVDNNGHIHRNRPSKKNTKKRKGKRSKDYRSRRTERLFSDAQHRRTKTSNSSLYSLGIYKHARILKAGGKIRKGGRPNHAYYGADRRPTVTENPQLAHLNTDN